LVGLKKQVLGEWRRIGWGQNGTLGALIIVLAISQLFSAQARAQPVNDYTSQAQLTPLRSTVISSEMPGKIIKLPFRGGERFKKGEELARFDCAHILSSLKKLEVVHASATRRHEVQKRLLKLNATGNLEVEIASLDVSVAGADIATQKVLISRCTIHAPFAGRVVEEKAKEWQYIPEGGALFEILDDSQLEVDFLISSSWVRWVKQGMPITVNVSETQKVYAAHIVRLGARIDPISQSLRVTARMNEHNPDLLPGMSGYVTLPSPVGKQK